MLLIICRTLFRLYGGHHQVHSFCLELTSMTILFGTLITLMCRSLDINELNKLNNAYFNHMSDDRRTSNGVLIHVVQLNKKSMTVSF